MMSVLKICLLVCGLVSWGAAQLSLPAECGDTMGCYHDCDDACTFLVTWVDGEDTVVFTLNLALDGASDQWISLGLSDDIDMADDSATDCVQNSGQLALGKSYNVQGKNNEPLTNASHGLTEGDIYTENGVLRCEYAQTKIPTDPRVFDLNTDWYLMVATGRASGGFKQRHSITELPAVSPRKADLQANEDISGVAINVMIKLHGCLMVFAWVFCASIGIVVARYYKPMWPQSTWCGLKVWFVLHRVLMSGALLVCVAGFIIIFVEVEGWSELEGSSSFKKAHPYLGVIVTFLCLLNPVMAMCRPDPDTKNRPLFNWAHFGVGTGAHVLSAITLIMGVTLGKAAVPFYTVYILLGWVAYQMIIVLMLEMHACCIVGAKAHYDVDGKEQAPVGSMVKKSALAVHVFIITAFTAVCIVIVAIN